MEKHHIVPRCLGGSDDPSNIAVLTAREHYIAHQILVKLYPGNVGLIFGARLMTVNVNNSGRVNNRLYEWLKVKAAEASSQVNKGRIHSQATKEKLSSIRKGRQPWNHGVPSTEEANRKRSETQKARFATQEHHLKGKPAHNKGKPSPKKGVSSGPKEVFSCEVCGKQVGGASNYKRWHSTNCKSQP